MKKVFQFVYFFTVSVPLCILFTLAANVYFGAKWLFALK